MAKDNKKPVRLYKKEQGFWEEWNMRSGIPLEFILITIIMICFFLLIIILMGPCTESGLVYNNNTLLNSIYLNGIMNFIQ